MKLANQHSFTVVRSEVIYGIQTGTQFSSESPVALLSRNEEFLSGTSMRPIFTFCNIFFHKSFNWYDPNTKVAGMEPGADERGFTAADIKQTTLGIGYVNYIENM